MAHNCINKPLLIREGSKPNDFKSITVLMETHTNIYTILELPIYNVLKGPALSKKKPLEEISQAYALLQTINIPFMCEKNSPVQGQICAGWNKTGFAHLLCWCTVVQTSSSWSFQIQRCPGFPHSCNSLRHFKGEKGDKQSYSSIRRN